jgi:hypothetical protein
VLDKLKEYKDVISIVIFFLGGFFWVQSELPKKDDLEAVKQELLTKNKVLKCLLKSNMTLVQNQIQASSLEKTIKEKQDYLVLSDKFPVENMSPAMKATLNELNEDVTNKKAELRAVIMRMQNTRSDLEKNICGEDV